MPSKLKGIMVRLTDEEHEWVTAQAESKNCSRAQYLRDFIRLWRTASFPLSADRKFGGADEPTPEQTAFRKKLLGKGSK